MGRDLAQGCLDAKALFGAVMRSQQMTSGQESKFGPILVFLAAITTVCSLVLKYFFSELLLSDKVYS
jgi:hypothetical protein